MRPSLSALLLTLTLATTAQAQPTRPQPLTGEFFLGGATLVDPSPGERADSHAYLRITGAAARRIFASMPGAGAVDACEPTRRLKRSGALQCTAGRAAADATCAFAIDLARGTLANGAVC
jgi:hypothetical protein